MKKSLSTEANSKKTIEQLLDTPAVAAIYRISIRSVPRLVEAGVIPPPIRIGRAVRWLPADIRASFEQLG